MKKTVFLDFDGVLHGTGPHNQGFFEYMSMFCAAVRPFTQNLNIVISSSWKKTLKFEELRDLFEEDIQPCVAGITPNHTDGYAMGGREREILEYCGTHNIDIKDWVAIDDLARFFTEGCANLILVNGETGITEADMARLIQFLQYGYTLHKSPSI